jgi:hypothetical protein
MQSPRLAASVSWTGTRYLGVITSKRGARHVARIRGTTEPTEGHSVHVTCGATDGGVITSPNKTRGAG